MKQNLATSWQSNQKVNIDYLSLARKLEKPVRDAGQAILDIYHQGSDVQIKGDGSPVTKADLASEAILLPAISVAAPFIQIVSEENAYQPWICSY